MVRLQSGGGTDDRHSANGCGTGVLGGVLGVVKVRYTACVSGNSAALHTTLHTDCAPLQTPINIGLAGGRIILKIRRFRNWGVPVRFRSRAPPANFWQKIAINCLKSIEKRNKSFFALPKK